MSMYHLIHGVNPIAPLLLSMLGEKHANEYPRFRDCWLDFDGEQDVIVVYTRVGGLNKGCGYGEEELMEHPSFIYDRSDDFDPTYGSYVFSVPSEFVGDYALIKACEPHRVSRILQNRCRATYPKLAQLWDSLWAPSSDNQEANA